MQREQPVYVPAEWAKDEVEAKRTQGQRCDDFKVSSVDPNVTEREARQITQLL